MSKTGRLEKKLDKWLTVRLDANRVVEEFERYSAHVGADRISGITFVEFLGVRGIGNVSAVKLTCAQPIYGKEALAGNPINLPAKLVDQVWDEFYTVGTTVRPNAQVISARKDYKKAFKKSQKFSKKWAKRADKWV